PFHGPFPVATRRRPFGSTTAPERAQIAESLDRHELGLISRWRSLQSEFQTWTIAPVVARNVTTWPWYGGASPMYPPVVAITSPRDTVSAGAIFSRRGRSVIAVDHCSRPSATASLRMRPSGPAT